jgi:regulator of replication initiation timing
VGVELGFIKKSGAWFTYEGEQLGQGRENVKTFLTENPQLMAEVDERIREHLANENAAKAELQAEQLAGHLGAVPSNVDDLSLDDQPITLSE